MKQKINALNTSWICTLNCFLLFKYDWIWCSRGMTRTGDSLRTQKNLSQCYFVHSQIPYGLPWGWTQASTVICWQPSPQLWHGSDAPWRWRKCSSKIMVPVCKSMWHCNPENHHRRLPLGENLKHHILRESTNKAKNHNLHTRFSYGVKQPLL